jgi:hypothetical protein
MMRRLLAAPLFTSLAGVAVFAGVTVAFMADDPVSSLFSGGITLSLPAALAGALVGLGGLVAAAWVTAYATGILRPGFRHHVEQSVVLYAVLIALQATHGTAAITGDPLGGVRLLTAAAILLNAATLLALRIRSERRTNSTAAAADPL